VQHHLLWSRARLDTTDFSCGWRGLAPGPAAFFLPETKVKTLEEIEEHSEGKK